MPTCIQADVNGSLSVVTPQPTDLATCQLLVLTPAEFPGATASLDQAQAAGFFAFGFSCVLISYLAAFAVGSQLKVLRTARN